MFVDEGIKSNAHSLGLVPVERRGTLAPRAYTPPRTVAVPTNMQPGAASAAASALLLLRRAAT